MDGNAATERDTLASQGDVLEPLRERSAVASPVDLSLLVPKPVTKKKAKKKATKKKAAKK